MTPMGTPRAGRSSMSAPSPSCCPKSRPAPVHANRRGSGTWGLNAVRIALRCSELWQASQAAGWSALRSVSGVSSRITPDIQIGIARQRQPYRPRHARAAKAFYQPGLQGIARAVADERTQGSRQAAVMFRFGKLWPPATYAPGAGSCREIVIIDGYPRLLHPQ